MPIPQPPHHSQLVTPAPGGWAIGLEWLRWLRDLVAQFNVGAAYLISGKGSPETVVTRSPGYLYIDLTNGKLYQKETGTGNVGWVLR